MIFEYSIEALNKRHQRRYFDCGEESLNVFLRNYARQNNEKGLGKTFVAVRPTSSNICGYYTLSSGSISFETIPEKLPRYPIPTAHLGRLAVDKDSKGSGLGGLLLIDALRRTVSVSKDLGIFAIEVWALNDSAKAFCMKYGFSELMDESNHLYMPVAAIPDLIR